MAGSHRGGGRGSLMVPAALAFSTAIFITLYIASTSKVLLMIHPNQTHLRVKPPVEFSIINTPYQNPPAAAATGGGGGRPTNQSQPAAAEFSDYLPRVSTPASTRPRPVNVISQSTQGEFTAVNSSGTVVKSMIMQEVFHDKDLFFEEYEEMNRTLKIYVYPHKKNDRFANVLLPVDYEPGGNYASESYFKKSIFRSHFITNDPNEAHLFFLPFSIAGLRNDKRVGVGGIKDFVKDYVSYVSREFPFWNRSAGADHFYVCCHSVGRSAMEKAAEVKMNAIQVVCSSSYFLPGYVAHKDASVPQIWPRPGDPPRKPPEERETLAFYAGALNSRVRQDLVAAWGDDSEISVHRSRLKTPYSEALLGSKFCIHAKGFEINTARIGDAIYYGCVPVILADFYDLPFADALNWESFSVVVSSMDIPKLKEILKGISHEEYVKLQSNVVKVQRHFRWHNFPVDFDAFHMVMFELWLRRSHVKVVY
ncbi:PREDICTED: probable glycosyltransferase At5g03795 isoform X2 [Ipomoea nil]|uniref:probable glycosyltransferase At5g03795 isoform X2 n=1 Tax=Ipomoea nil TaxID=35883 RepID=UPI000900CEDD|nr:PREDICTED: probable glycosyltransferase At5g03795 isoform X2 [Ipomoea nil]